MEFFTRQRSRALTVKILENGETIPSEMVGQIFDRSMHAIPAPAPQNQNAGESQLYGIDDVTGMHPGHVFVNGKAGGGSAFLFTLPAVMSDGEENFDHEQAAHSSRRQR